jgi:leucyl-tRNA synthetase
MICNTTWPSYNTLYLQEDSITFVIQINNKIRDTITLPRDTTRERVKESALQSSKVRKYLHNKKIMKEIFVENKLLNFVIMKE